MKKTVRQQRLIVLLGISILLVLFAVIIGGWLYSSRPLQQIGGPYKIANGQVYYRHPNPIAGWLPVENADSRTFTYIGGEEVGQYAKDNQRVYIRQETLEGGADQATFQVIGGGYSRDKNHVYYDVYVVADADPSSFVYVGGGFGKDKNHLYRYNTIVPGADPAQTDSIQLIGEEGLYAKDKNHVYFHGKIVPGADPETFGCFEEYCPDYAKDKSQAYYEGQVIPGVDVTTVQYDVGGYLKDKAHVYYRGDILPDANPETFGTIPGDPGSNSSYLLDNDQVYYNGRLMRDADPSTFEVLANNRNYAKDRRGVYYKGENIEGADPATFQFVCSGLIEDKAHVSRRVVLGKDKNNVYRMGEIVLGVDPATYPFDECFRGNDLDFRAG